MKKWLILALICIFMCGAVQAETAREYAAWLEEVLPDAAFTDIEVPGFVTEYLGTDYDFIARSDSKYGNYIAGVRKDNAPELPEDAFISSGGTFFTQVFRVLDESGKVYYEFILGDGVNIGAYDDLKHLVIHIDESQAEYIPFASHGSIMFTAADAKLRAQMVYGREHGFSAEDKTHPQLCMYVHNIDTWRTDATDQPYAFYLDVDVPQDLTGNQFLEEDELIQFTRIPIGLYVKEDENGHELVVSQSGLKAVETDNPHRLYEAGPGYDALVDQAAKVLGYRPGDVDFLGKDSVRATLEWKDNSVCIEDAETLDKLDAMFSKADFSVGSVNCPSPCFLTLEYEDGSSISIAVAINSFDLFFCNGMYFTAGDGELLKLFNLKEENLNIKLFGG